jgi:hypothetical protein
VFFVPVFVLCVLGGVVVLDVDGDNEPFVAFHDLHRRQPGGESARSIFRILIPMINEVVEVLVAANR